MKIPFLIKAGCWLLFFGFAFAEPMPRIAVSGLSISGWIEMLEEESELKYVFYSDEVGKLHLSFDSQGPIELQDLQNAFKLLLNMNGIQLVRQNHIVLLTKGESTSFEKQFDHSFEERLPLGWISSPDELIESMEMDDMNVLIVAEIIQMVSGKSVLRGSYYDEEDSISLKLLGVTRREATLKMITESENLGYRFILKDGFLLMKKTHNKMVERNE